MVHLILMLLALALITSGCTSLASRPNQADAELSAATETDGAVAPPAAKIPALDISRHSVPLDEVIFDTFSAGNREVPLTEATPAQIDQLRDAIPPLHKPRYERADEADWLAAADIILGYRAGDQAWAFPVKMLNYHEIVNDVFADEPVLISYCPLCYSGIVFSRTLGDQVLNFGNTSALYESDMVMLDYESGSYWWQVTGQAIVGALTREELELLPSMMATWDEWRSLHPATLVLSRDTGFGRDYSRDPFQGIDSAYDAGRFVFPVSDATVDARLAPGNKVLAVKMGEVAHAPIRSSARS